VNRAGGRSIGLTGNDGSMLQVRRRVVDGRDLAAWGRWWRSIRADRAVSDAATCPWWRPRRRRVGPHLQRERRRSAGSIARALGAEKLILLTDVEGVKDGSGRLISRLTREEVRKLLAEARSRRHDPEGGVPRRPRGGRGPHHIIDGRILHAVLLEVFTDVGVGTLIIAEMPKDFLTLDDWPARSCSRSSRAPGAEGPAAQGRAPADAARAHHGDVLRAPSLRTHVTFEAGMTSSRSRDLPLPDQVGVGNARVARTWP